MVEQLCTMKLFVYFIAFFNSYQVVEKFFKRLSTDDTNIRENPQTKKIPSKINFNNFNNLLALIWHSF